MKEVNSTSPFHIKNRWYSALCFFLHQNRMWLLISYRSFFCSSCGLSYRILSKNPDSSQTHLLSLTVMLCHGTTEERKNSLFYFITRILAHKRNWLELKEYEMRVGGVSLLIHTHPYFPSILCFNILDQVVQQNQTNHPYLSRL